MPFSFLKSILSPTSPAPQHTISPTTPLLSETKTLPSIPEDDEDKFVDVAEDNATDEDAFVDVTVDGAKTAEREAKEQGRQLLSQVKTIREDAPLEPSFQDTQVPIEIDTTQEKLHQFFDSERKSDIRVTNLPDFKDTAAYKLSWTADWVAIGADGESRYGIPIAYCLRTDSNTAETNSPQAVWWFKTKNTGYIVLLVAGSAALSATFVVNTFCALSGIPVAQLSLVAINNLSAGKLTLACFGAASSAYVNTLGNMTFLPDAFKTIPDRIRGFRAHPIQTSVVFLGATGSALAAAMIGYDSMAFAGKSLAWSNFTLNALALGVSRLYGMNKWTDKVIAWNKEHVGLSAKFSSLASAKTFCVLIAAAPTSFIFANKFITGIKLTGVDIFDLPAWSKKLIGHIGSFATPALFMSTFSDGLFLLETAKNTTKIRYKQAKNWKEKTWVVAQPIIDITATGFSGFSNMSLGDSAITSGQGFVLDFIKPHTTSASIYNYTCAGIVGSFNTLLVIKCKNAYKKPLPTYTDIPTRSFVDITSTASMGDPEFLDLIQEETKALPPFLRSKINRVSSHPDLTIDTETTPTARVTRSISSIPVRRSSGTTTPNNSPTNRYALYQPAAVTGPSLTPDTNVHMTDPTLDVQSSLLP